MKGRAALPALHLTEGGMVSHCQALGRAMAHESGHLLLGTNSHFPVGIMRADWTQKDLQCISREGLQFTSEQAERMRQAVQARIEHHTLAAK